MSERLEGRPLEVGVIGAGTVGGGVIRELQETGEATGLRLRRVAISNPNKPREFQAPYTDNVEDIFKDPHIDAVVEVTGGIDAEEHIFRAINGDMALVTADKAVLARSARTIFDAARDKVDVGYEASVAAKIPIMDILRYFEGEEIYSISGSFNGTSEYIFTRMREDGTDYPSALEMAQAKGFAEPNPTMDVKGLDARNKIVFVASLAWKTQFDPNKVTPTGIEEVTIDDMDIAGWLGTMRRRNRKSGPGYIIQPLAIARKHDDGSVEIGVSPALIRKDRPLASIREEQNGITIETKNGSSITIQGPGAGRDATTSAIMADLRRIRRNREKGIIDDPPTLDGNAALRKSSEAKSGWYIRLNLKDVSGSLRRLGEVLETYDLSVQHSIQDEAPEEIDVFKSDFVTLHPVEREKVMSAVRDLERLDRVNGTPFVLPIWG